jgi:hypothetical protein
MRARKNSASVGGADKRRISRMWAGRSAGVWPATVAQSFEWVPFVARRMSGALSTWPRLRVDLTGKGRGLLPGHQRDLYLAISEGLSMGHGQSAWTGATRSATCPDTINKLI